MADETPPAGSDEERAKLVLARLATNYEGFARRDAFKKIAAALRAAREEERRECAEIAEMLGPETVVHVAHLSLGLVPATIHHGADIAAAIRGRTPIDHGPGTGGGTR